MALSFKNRPGLVAYVTCGDPDLETTKMVVLAAATAGADVIELGVPALSFRQPVSGLWNVAPSSTTSCNSRAKYVSSPTSG
jgi:tryptophan synthase alpha subunit